MKNLPLRYKLLIVMVIVGLAGLGTVLFLMEWIGPALFARYLGEAMDRMHGSGVGMMGDSMFQMMALHAREAFRRTVNETLALATIGGLLASIVMTLFVSERIVRPLAALKTSSIKIAQGDYENRLDVNSGDEIGQLARSFNRMAATLARSEKERREFISAVGHELRTPVANLQAYVEGMVDGVLPTSRENLASLEGEVKRLNRLLDDFSVLTQGADNQMSLEPGVYYPEEIVVGPLEILRPRFMQTGLDFAVNVEEDLPAVRADRERTQQVLLNILSNALRYVPSGSRVTLKVCRDESPGHVRFDIIDSGPGIAKEHLPFLFDRFYRVDKSRTRKGGGSGLGLAIAKTLVTAQGGRIWVESTPGAGTRFSFTLPTA